MRKTFKALAACLLLSGCNTMMSNTDAANAHALCLNAGYQAGSKELADCTLSTYERTQDSRTAGMQALGAAATALSEQMREQQQREWQNFPRITRCQQFGNQMQCVTTP